MESKIRIAAFEWLKKQVDIYGEVLPRNVLEKGFLYGDERISLVAPNGIFKPKIFSEIPLSITTAPNGPYNDAFSGDGYLAYRYRGTDPMHRDNVGLRKAMLKQIPLIYFHGILPGKYLAIWPVYIVGDNPAKLTFTVAADLEETILDTVKGVKDDISTSNDSSIQRKYVTREVKQRVHQSVFRERVLNAYRDQCSFCRLRHRELLDAAHIIPDSDEMGEPIVNNGLSLCKIHHAAFDRSFIGVSPDYKIFVRNDLLEEHDGPMLKYGIQEMHGRNIILPNRKSELPDREMLAQRFDEFMRA